MPLTRHERSVSPSGGSILITSAPKSASCRVRMLPATRRDKSTTRTPFRGPRAEGLKGCFLGCLVMVRSADLPVRLYLVLHEADLEVRAPMMRDFGCPTSQRVWP